MSLNLFRVFLHPYYGLMSLMSCSFKFFEELLNTPHFIRNVEMSVKGTFQQHLKDLCGTLQLCYVVFFSWEKNRCKPNSGFGIGAQVCIGLATCCVFLFPLMMSSTPSLSPRVLSPRHAQLLVLGGTAPRLVSFWTVLVRTATLCHANSRSLVGYSCHWVDKYSSTRWIANGVSLDLAFWRVQPYLHTNLRFSNTKQANQVLFFFTRLQFIVIVLLHWF